jgi:hypothetical protein
MQSQQYQALQAQLLQAAQQQQQQQQMAQQQQAPQQQQQQQQQQYGAYQGYGTAAQNMGAYASPPDMTGWQQSQ